MAEQTIEALQNYASQLSEAATQAKAAANVQHQLVHGGPTQDVLTEGGLVPSLAKQAVLGQQQVANVLENIATQLAGATVYSTIAKGLLATVNGAYFSVRSAVPHLYVDMYLNNNGTAVYETSYLSNQADSITLNKGKAFPFKQLTRAGVTSVASTVLNNFILNVKIIGDDAALEGKYYRIAYFQNDATIGSNADQGIVIEQFDAATYAATGVATTIHNHTDAPAGIIRNGGVQTFVIAPASMPTVRFVITVDAASLPAAGTPINALTSAQAHYSWIIDPSCHVRVLTIGDSLTVNKGKVYPLRKMTRNTIASAEHPSFSRAILDIKVRGARPGKFYRLAYYVNGSTALPTAKPDGWIVEEIDQANYATADNPYTQVIRLADESTPTILRDGIQTVHLVSSVVLGLTVTITLDTAELPALGGYISAVQTYNPGYSFIIDPATYTMASSGAAGTAPLTYQVGAGGRITIVWDDGDIPRGFTFGPTGQNNLPNFAELLRDGAIIGTYGTDWLPPLVFDVKRNGDAGGLNFTGGNHLVGDVKTAVNIQYDIEADGVPLVPGDGGRADRITCRVVNKIMAGNAVTLGRYSVIQSLQLDFAPGACNVHAEVMALEDVQFYIDYGCQMVAGGVSDTLFYLGGQLSEPVPFDSTLTSGSPSVYPEAWAALCTSANGQLAAWIDRSYGVADGKQVSEAYGMIIGGGAASTKQYTTAIHRFLQRNPDSPNYMELPSGKSYKWRGGYSWGPVDVKPGFVASLRYLDNGRMRRANAINGTVIINP
ncbi:hypothetical protein H4C81_06825 [Pseudomonas monteilii]|uniref:hypothetical protein n=1 Tax=Pseudomonas monteilii TaxID=76759 RepID=UPI0015F8ECD6|nr:hypothetical protein [Pseudomonas monteilii]MBA6088606.1 hypothetical protein [Pseudomonas monteilii]